MDKNTKGLLETDICSTISLKAILFIFYCFVKIKVNG